MKKNILLSAVIITAIYTTAYTNEVSPKKEITMEEFVNIAAAKLPELKLNSIQVEYAENNKDKIDAMDDVYLGGSANYYKKSIYPQTGADAIGTTGIYSDVNAKKKFSYTGTTLSAGSSLTTATPEKMNKSYNPTVFAAISQSILKNAFGMADRHLKNNAAAMLEVEKLKQKENDKTNIANLKKLYITWMKYQQEMKILETSVKNAERLYSAVLKKSQQGMTEIEDAQNAKATLLNYKESYQRSAVKMRQIENEINLYLNVASYMPSDSEIDLLYAKSRNFTYVIIPFTKVNSCEIYKLTRNNLIISKDIDSNGLLPELNLVGQVSLSSKEDSFGTAASSMSNVDYFAGFEASYPIGSSEAKSSLRETEIRINEINLEYDKSENFYKKSLSGVIESAEGLKTQIEIKTEKLKTLNQLYQVQNTKYLQARTDITNLLLTANSIAQENLNLVELKFSLIENYIDYENLTRF